MNETRMDMKEYAEIARTRAALCSFLTIHFNVLPDEKFIKQMRRKEIVSMLKILPKDTSINEDLAAGAALMENFIEETHDDKPTQLSEKLGVDRTRLYRGISPVYGPPPPYEMVWSKTWQDVALLQTLAGIYREKGLAPSSDMADRMDYLGLELEFLRALAQREITAWEAGKTETAYSNFEEQKKFFQEHMQQWVPDFIQKALEYVKTDFYRGHLLMLRGFVAEQAEIFSSLSSS
jgi:putative dimethyl sulfoxide reductase chaperone